MNDFAIVFSTSDRYCSQALAMYEQLRMYGLEKYAWVVPLTTLTAENIDNLQTYFRSHVTETLQIPKSIKLSGNKVFLPRMVPAAKKYILLDTDILILEREFIDRFLDCPDDRIAIVKDTFSWQDWFVSRGFSPRKTLNIETCSHLLNQPYIQTGSVGISSQVYKKIVDPFVGDLLDERRQHRGDLTIWNDWVRRFPNLFHLLPAQSCLVLRSDGLGPSSKLHIPDLSYEDKIFCYRDRPILALHYTSSKGMVRRWKDYEKLIQTLNQN